MLLIDVIDTIMIYFLLYLRRCHTQAEERRRSDIVIKELAVLHNPKCVRFSWRIDVLHDRN